MLFPEFFDIVCSMNLHSHQKRLLQQLDLIYWVVKSDFLLIQVTGGPSPLILKFSVSSVDKVQRVVTQICHVLSLRCVQVDQGDIVVDCACEPKQIYEKIRDHCFKREPHE